MISFFDQARAAVVEGNRDKAFAMLVAAASESPTREVWASLAVLLSEHKQYDAAVLASERCLGLAAEPEWHELNNLGWNLHLTGQSERGFCYLMQAKAKAPDQHLIWRNLSQCMLPLGNAGKALEYAERAVRLNSEDPRSYLARGLAYFALGEWEKGFSDYDYRIAANLQNLLHYPYARWLGEMTSRLFIQNDMGMGDAIWALRFMGDGLISAEDGVIYGVQPPLVRLFEDYIGEQDKIVALPCPLPQADLWCPMMSLPTVLGMMRGQPDGSPYLAAVKPCRNKEFSVGIAWSTGAASEDSRWRDIPVLAFAPVIAMRDVAVHSLQFGGSGEIERLGLLGLVRDRGPELTDLRVTADVAGEMDLVLTADSVTAHLCGAMGVPVWLLRSAKAAPWIWPLVEGSTPWYNSMRVWICGRDEGWPALMKRVAVEVRRLVDEHANNE